VKALRDFRGKLNDQSVAVIYYSGHGVQVGGGNYLLPVDLQAKYA
jgi:uncharacterized caspase-like protein